MTARACAPGRAFALPVVLVVMLVVTSVAAIMLRQFTAQRLIAERQLHGYQEHHARYGIEEVLASWIRTIPRNVQLLGTLGQDGHAVDLLLGDGTVGEVYLRDGQGAVLAVSEGVSPEDAPWVERVAAVYQDLCASSRAEPVLREVGPAALSIQSAPTEAFEAVFSVLFPDSDYAEALAIIDANRGAGEPGETLRQVQTALQLDGEGRQRLARAVVARPTLHFVEVRLRPSRGSRQGVMARFGGYVLIERGAGLGDDPWTSRSSFLTWNPIGVE